MKKIITLAIIIFLSSGAKAMTVNTYETMFKNISGKNAQTLFDTYIAGVLNTVYEMNDISDKFYKKKLFCVDRKDKQENEFFLEIYEKTISKLEKTGFDKNDLSIEFIFLMGLVTEFSCNN